MAIRKAESDSDVEDKPDEVTACFPEQKFSPIEYHSFGVGPFFCKTHPRDGETTEQAMARAYAVCEKAARGVYSRARDEHLANVADSDDKARSLMTSRKKRG